MTPEDHIDAVLRAVLEQAGDEMVADMQSRLSVDYDGEASKPGQYPRKRSGDLRGGIEKKVVDEGGQPSLAVVSRMPYSRRLVDTGRLLLGELRDDWAPKIADRITRAFSS